MWEQKPGCSCLIFCEKFNSLPNNKILDSSKLKDFVDDNFEFDRNGRNFSEWVENTVGKGEIAHYEQCFQKTFTPFPAVFSKDLHYKHVKIRACLGKG